jgi:hypothetical protein
VPRNPNTLRVVLDASLHRITSQSVVCVSGFTAICKPDCTQCDIVFAGIVMSTPFAVALYESAHYGWFEQAKLGCQRLQSDASQNRCRLCTRNMPLICHDGTVHVLGGCCLSAGSSILVCRRSCENLSAPAEDLENLHGMKDKLD